jgi:hypothetical protein
MKRHGTGTVRPVVTYSPGGTSHPWVEGTRKASLGSAHVYVSSCTVSSFRFNHDETTISSSFLLRHHLSPTTIDCKETSCPAAVSPSCSSICANIAIGSGAHKIHWRTLCCVVSIVRFVSITTTTMVKILVPSSPPSPIPNRSEPWSDFHKKFHSNEFHYSVGNDEFMRRNCNYAPGSPQKQTFKFIGKCLFPRTKGQK